MRADGHTQGRAWVRNGPRSTDVRGPRREVKTVIFRAGLGVIRNRLILLELQRSFGVEWVPKIHQTSLIPGHLGILCLQRPMRQCVMEGAGAPRSARSEGIETLLSLQPRVVRPRGAHRDRPAPRALKPPRTSGRTRLSCPWSTPRLARSEGIETAVSPHHFASLPLRARTAIGPLRGH